MWFSSRMKGGTFGLLRIWNLENPLPTLLKEGPYRFFFYSNEGDPREPPHVHVTAGERVAKFWLEPVELV